jgi:hypothetical protein
VTKWPRGALYAENLDDKPMEMSWPWTSVQPGAAGPSTSRPTSFASRRCTAR